VGEYDRQPECRPAQEPGLWIVAIALARVDAVSDAKAIANKTRSSSDEL